MEQSPPQKDVTKLPRPFHLSSVHECLAIAAAAPRRPPEGTPPMGTHTFRIPDDIKDLTGELCERHGATLDGFLRECCRRLLYDYKQL